MLNPRLNAPWLALRFAFGAVMIIAGLDKFTSLLTDWTLYLSPVLEQLLPFSASMFMQLVGILEIVAGILVLTVLTRLGAYILSGWFVAIAFNLVTTGRFFDVAVGDLVMAVGAFSLGRMTEVRDSIVKLRLVSMPPIRDPRSRESVV